MNSRPSTNEQGRPPFWELVLDPSVTNSEFRRVHQEYLEYREELERIGKRSISRREFNTLAASAASAFALATTVGSIAGARTTHAATDKAVKKGTIRYGYVNTLDCMLLAYVIEHKGIFESLGYDVVLVGAPAGPQVMEAFIANEVDFAYVGANTPGLAAQRGIESRHIVGGMVGHGGWTVHERLYDQGVTDFPSFFEYAEKRRDEGNPVVVTSQVPGTLTHAAAMRTVMEYGLEPDTDVDMRYLPAPEVASALVSGMADAQTNCEQFSSFPEYYGRGKVIGHCLDSGPHMMHCDGLPEQTYTQCTALAARPGLPDEMIQDVITAHRLASEYMAAHPEETVQIAVDVSGTPAPTEYVAMFNRARWHYGLNFESVDSVWNDTMVKIGMARQAFKLDELVDTHNAVELQAPFESTGGVTQRGPVDVTSDAFRRRVWGDAMRLFEL